MIATLFCHALHAADVAFIAFHDGYWQVWTMQANGANQRRLTSSPYDKAKLSWYPDGKFLLVNGSQGELNKVNARDGREQPVKLPLTGIADAVIAPDGERIAFSLSVAGATDRNDIWLVDKNGQNQQKLTRMQGLQHEPVWSHDGESLYFLSGITGSAKRNHDIWRHNIEESALTQLTSNALYHFDIDVSSQGLLAYSNNRVGNYEIFTRDDQGVVKRITTHEALDAKPAWSPNGKSLLFESTRSGKPNIWHINLENGELEQLTDVAVGARHPTWFRGEKVSP